MHLVLLFCRLTDRTGTPLDTTCYAQLKLVVMLLVLLLVQIDGQNRHTFKYKPRKLLHQAVTCGDATTTGLLLQYGADVDAQDHNVSSLHLSAFWVLALFGD